MGGACFKVNLWSGFCDRHGVRKMFGGCHKKTLSLKDANKFLLLVSQIIYITTTHLTTFIKVLETHKK